jgi:HSP20 family protein
MSNLTRWQVSSFGRLSTLQDELQRLFESPWGELTRAQQFLRGWNPAVDLFEDKDNVFVKAELPGLKKEDIDVSLEDGVLTISGERKSEEKVEGQEARRSERFYGQFRRSITLSSEVKADHVTATYKDGVLTVALPKVEAAKPKQIEIKAN